MKSDQLTGRHEETYAGRKYWRQPDDNPANLQRGYPKRMEIWTRKTFSSLLIIRHFCSLDLSQPWSKWSSIEAEKNDQKFESFDFFQIKSNLALRIYFWLWSLLQIDWS